MSSEILRRAAALMRERAGAATPGPWVSASDGRSTELLADDGADVIYRRVMDMQAPADAEHIASWHPAVALAVADWLDYLAGFEGEMNSPSVTSDSARWKPHGWGFAVLVARTYLGESA